MKVRFYQMHIDLIDWADGILMRALDFLSASRKKAWKRWNAARQSN